MRHRRGGRLGGGRRDDRRPAPPTLWAPALFAPAAAALHVGLLPGAALESTLGRRLAFLPFAILAAAVLVLVPGASGFAPAVGVLLFTPVALARAIREPRLALLPWVAALAGLLALLGWTIPDWLRAG